MTKTTTVEQQKQHHHHHHHYQQQQQHSKSNGFTFKSDTNEGKFVISIIFLLIISYEII